MSEIISATYCKSNAEAIKSDSFMRVFEMAIKHSTQYIGHLDTKPYLDILDKYKEDKKITNEEMQALLMLCDNKWFFNVAKSIFERSISFSGTREEVRNFNITPESVRNELKKEITLKTARDMTREEVMNLTKGSVTLTDPEKQSGVILYSDNDIVVFTLRNYTFLRYVDTNGISKTQELYNKADSYSPDFCLFVFPDNGGGCFLANKKGEKIYKTDCVDFHFNNSFDFSRYNTKYGGFIIVGGEILLDRNGQILFDGAKKNEELIDLYVERCEENGESILRIPRCELNLNDYEEKGVIHFGYESFNSTGFVLHLTVDSTGQEITFNKPAEQQTQPVPSITTTEKTPNLLRRISNFFGKR